MKKTICIILAALMILCMAACGEVKQETKTEEGFCYEAFIQGDRARQIVSILLGSETEELLNAGELDGAAVRLYAADGKLTKLSIISKSEDWDGAVFHMEADLEPQPVAERMVIPTAVLNAISNDKTEPEEFSEDILVLLSAFIRNETADTVDAKISVNAECGVLNLDSEYDYFRKKLGEQEISCVSSNLFEIYFTETAACTSKGVRLSAAEDRLLDSAKLIPIAKELFTTGTFKCSSTGAERIYSIMLTPESAKDIAEKLLPDLSTLNITYDDCEIRIILKDDAISAIELQCGGSMRMVARDIETSLNVRVLYTEPGEHQIPYIVRQNLELNDT